MIVKFLVAFLLFFLFTPGVFLHLPQNGKVVMVALVHSILFTLIMWLLSNLMNIREGLTYEQWKENKEQIREYRKEQREKKWREDHPGFHVHHYRDRHHHRHHAQKKTHANKAVAPAPAPAPAPIPTFPYELTFSTVSMGNCKGYSAAYNNLSEYKEITGKTLSSTEGANVCVVILTTKNEYDYRSAVYNIENSLQTNHPIVFTLPSNYPQKPNQYKYADGQYTLTNIVKADNPIIKKFTNNTTNTLLGVLSKTYPNVENGTNMKITFSLTTKPVVLAPSGATPVSHSPAIPNKSPAPAPSVVKLTKEQILTIDSFSHVLKTVVLGGYVNFNTTTIICTSNNSNDFDNITYRLGVILSNNRKLSFTFQDKTYNVNQMITDPTQISQYVTTTTNRFLLVVDGNYSETLTKNNVNLSFTMKKEASIAPSPKGADTNTFKETIYQVGLGTIPQISTSASYFTLTMTSNSDVNSLVEKIQKPLGENKFLTMTLENDPTNYLINKVITDRTTVSYVKTPPTNTFVVVLNTIHPGFGGTGIKSNMDVTFTIGKTRPPVPVPVPAPSGQSYTPSYAPSGPINPAPAPSGQSFTPSYAPSGQSYSPVIAPAPAYVNPNVFSDTVNTLMIGGDYTINGTYMSIVLFNMSTNSDAMNLAKKLQTPLSNNKTLSMTLPSSFSTYGGQTFELTSIITQQSIVETVTTSSNSFIGVLDKQYSSQIPGQNVIVTFTIGKEKSVSPTSKQIITPAPAPAPVIIAKPPAPSGSYSITANMVLIGGTYNYTNNQYVYPVAFYMNSESQQKALYTELQSRLQSGSLTFTLPATFPFYKNQKLQISQLVPTTDPYYGSFAQGIPYGVVGLLNNEATNQQFEQTTNVVFN